MDKLKRIRTEMDKRKEKKVKMEKVLQTELPDEELDHIFDGEYVEKKGEEDIFDNFTQSKRVLQ